MGRRRACDGRLVQAATRMAPQKPSHYTCGGQVSPDIIAVARLIPAERHPGRRPLGRDMDLTTQTLPGDGYVTLRVSGELDMHTAATLRDAALEALRQH